MTNDDFIHKYQKVAYFVAGKFYYTRQTDIDTDDIRQLSLLYLWEAYTKYNNTRGASFETFAEVYIYNRLVNYFKHLNTQKNQSIYKRAYLNTLDDDEVDGLDSIAASQNNEDSLPYNLLKWDIEMALHKMKRKVFKNKRKQNVYHGIRILEGLIKGETSDYIMKQLDLKKTDYNNYLHAARKELRVQMQDGII